MITEITKLKGFGNLNIENLSLGKDNLIYGYNASGKTGLSTF